MSNSELSNRFSQALIIANWLSKIDFAISKSSAGKILSPKSSKSSPFSILGGIY